MNLIQTIEKEEIAKIKSAAEIWEKEKVQKSLNREKERKEIFTSMRQSCPCKRPHTSRSARHDSKTANKP